ncbi:MAG: hypothetical protein JNK18_12395 [Cyclobacteriaceae bacterium]|nr:hypothetical protein [Cyclobacteriaceae bacterium]
MRKVVVCLVLVITSLSAKAQWAFELWHEGKVVLATGDTLRGQVKYDLQQDIIQFTDKRGTVEAFSARKVLFCEIFDTTVGSYRQFYSLPYTATSGYRTPVFFELIAEGKLTVLSREKLENQTTTSPYYYGSFSRTVLVNKYFMLKENGDIVDFSTRKNDFLQLVGRHADIMNGFMKDNKLQLDDKKELAQIINYYNSLFKK